MLSNTKRFDDASFEDSIEFLQERVEDSLYNGIVFQSEDMDSEAFNATMAVIESGLNRMYEKFRVLEEALAYGKEFIEQKVSSSTKECMAILSVIEDDRNAMKNSAYISYEVSFSEGRNASFADRDSSPLPHCSVMNRTLTVSSNTIADVPYSKIEKVNGPVPYRNTIGDLLTGGIYRSFYVMDTPATGGVREQILLTFSEPSLVNFVDIAPTKCTVSDIAYIYENGIEEHEDTIITGVTKFRKIKSIRFTLTSDMYKNIEYAVDLSRMKSNFWDTVKDAEYKNASGTLTVIDLEELSGMEDRAEAYKRYVEDYDRWTAEKKKADEDALRYQQSYSEYVRAKAEYDANQTAFQNDVAAWKAKYNL